MYSTQPYKWVFFSCTHVYLDVLWALSTSRRLCQSWHFTARGTKTDSKSSVFADVMPVDQPGVLLALYYGLSFACMLMLIFQWWVRDRTLV